MPVVGVITPEAHAAVQATRNRRIGLLATKATVASGRYEQLVRTLDAGVRMTSVACPRLVPLIESDDPFGPQTAEAVREYAEPLKDADVDTVVLGCTHYPLIRPIFQRVFGRGVTLVFSAEETAREVAETLARKGIENAPDREGAYRFLTTGDPETFRVTGARFLQLPIDDVERVGSPSSSGRLHEPRTTGAGPTSSGRSRSSPTTSSSRTGPCSSRRGRRGCCARRRSRRASRAGWPGAARAGSPPSTRCSRPRPASARSARRRPGSQKGRTVEIQRLIGRARARGHRLRGARRADALARLRRPPGRRRHPLRGDLRRVRRRQAGARSVRPLEGDARLGRGRVARDRRRRAAPRPRLLGGLEGRRRPERGHDRRRAPRRGAGDRRAGAVRPRPARRAARARHEGDRPIRAAQQEAVDAPRT